MKLITKPVSQALRFGVQAEVAKHIKILEEKHGLILNGISGPWWAGGSLLRMLWTGEFPDSNVDLDIFIPEAYWKEDWDKRAETDDWAADYASTRRSHVGGVFNCLPYQFIKTMHTSLSEVFAAFDIVACRIATDGNKVIGEDAAFYDIQSGHLVVDEDTYNNKSRARVEKFQDLGLKWQGAYVDQFNTPISASEQKKLRAWKFEKEDDIPF